jgi:glycosyltransferase involved in cell wall biosynthesis
VHDIQFARGMNPARHAQASRALAQLVRALEPDLVHAHFSAAIFTTALAHSSAWPTTMATFHGLSFPAQRGWKAAVLRQVETWAARQFDAVWVLTDDDRDRLRAASSTIRVETLSSFGVGCNLAKFEPPSSAAKSERRGELGFREQDRVFAFVGRFVDFKGFALTARAFLRLAEEDSSARLLLIGARDPLHPTGLTPAEERALWNSTRMLDTGFRRDVHRYLVAADALVFPSSREGMPVCAMEALAMGVPVITRASRGCRHVVRDGIDGLVLEDCSAENLRAAMRGLTGDPALRDRLSQNAIAGRDRFARRHFIEEQKRILARVADAVPSRAPRLEPAYS